MVVQSIKNKREIKLLLQTHYPEVDYSLFIMVIMVGTLEKEEIPPAAAPAELPLQSSLILDLF
jgi:hypothetical protein